MRNEAPARPNHMTFGFRFYLLVSNIPVRYLPLTSTNFKLPRSLQLGWPWQWWSLAVTGLAQSWHSDFHLTCSQLTIRQVSCAGASIKHRPTKSMSLLNKESGHGDTRLTGRGLPPAHHPPWLNHIDPVPVRFSALELRHLPRSFLLEPILTCFNRLWISHCFFPLKKELFKEFTDTISFHSSFGIYNEHGNLEMERASATGSPYPGFSLGESPGTDLPASSYHDTQRIDRSHG